MLDVRTVPGKHMKKQNTSTTNALSRDQREICSTYQPLLPYCPIKEQPIDEELQVIVKLLAEKFRPLYIYCFGDYAESSRKVGCFIDGVAHHHHRYYLLMVIEGAGRIEHIVQDYASSHFQQGAITILVHGKDTLAEAVRSNNRFFITVINKGKLLYSHDPMIKSFQVPDYIPTRAADKAQKHYHRSITLATGFLESAQECLRNEKPHLSMFMLHQVVEQCCIGMIRIHLGYKSDIHHLYRLLYLCESFSPAISGLLLSNDQEQKRLFDLLAISYSAARYQDNFVVCQADAEKLYHRVAAFLKFADELCLDQIERMALASATENKINPLIFDGK